MHRDGFKYISNVGAGCENDKRFGLQLASWQLHYATWHLVEERPCVFFFSIFLSFHTAVIHVCYILETSWTDMNTDPWNVNIIWRNKWDILTVIKCWNMNLNQNWKLCRHRRDDVWWHCDVHCGLKPFWLSDTALWIARLFPDLHWCYSHCQCV